MEENNYSSLDVSGLTALTVLDAFDNDLISLDTTTNTALQELNLINNDITGLIDFSNNTALNRLVVNGNINMVGINLANGNNSSLTDADFTSNPMLSCLQVDSIAVAQAQETAGNWLKDGNTNYSVDCFTTLGAPQINENAFTMYPNPVQDVLTIDWVQQEDASVKIYDARGILVFERSIQSGTNEIVTSGLPTGIYFVKIKTSEGTLSRKLIKK